MVKITNVFGDVKTGKQEGAVYQRRYGKQIRRTLQEKKNANTEVQLQQRARFKVGIDFAKGLTKAERDFIKSYMAEAGITAPDGLPTTWYTYAKKIAMSVPRVVFETEAGGAGFSGAYATWSYRKPVTLTNSGSSQTDYQVLITLTSANFDYSKCNEDGSDLRFAASNGTTPLNYWIEDWNYNGTSKVWVKVDNVPNGENVCLYVYYGNAAATTESNGENTFVFFDDFPGTSFDDKWTSVHSSWSVTNGTAKHTLTGTSWDQLAAANVIADGILTAKIKISNDGTNDELGIFVRCTGTYQDSTSIQFISRLDNPDFTNIEYGNDKGTCANAISYNTWHYLKMTFHGSNIKSSYSTDNNTYTTCKEYTTTHLTEDDIGFRAIQATSYVDWINIRKYAATEPSTVLGSEETPSSTTLKGFTIHHPAVKSYEVLDTNIKAEGLSNLEDHISTSASRANLEVTATTLKVVTLADQEYLFEIM